MESKIERRMRTAWEMWYQSGGTLTPKGSIDLAADERIRREDTEELLVDLVEMIDRSNPIDDHGHPLRNSIVFLRAKEFVGEK